MRPLTIGLTGGIGAGKSLALSAFSGKRLDADQLARDTFPKAAIEKAFGTSDRKELAKLVFADPAKRRKLEKLTHPRVVAAMKRELSKGDVVVCAVPLLFEAKLEKLFDVTVTIEAPENVRRRRVAKRDALTEAQIRARMKAQLSEAERTRRADVVIRNEGKKSEFLAKVRSYDRAFALLRHGAAVR